MITSEKMLRILDICSKEISVKNEVIKNHDNNLWWPIDISDKRIRLLIAGLSTRVSYNMIAIYKQVILHICQYKYEEIIVMSDRDLSTIVTSLGLIKTRIAYLRSMMIFIELYYDCLEQYNNEELIQLISKTVNGASYKVAQCCVLYLRDYYCGVMPVDSGMKDVLLPCIGFSKQKGSIAHEILRIKLEEIVKNLNLGDIIEANGYRGYITIPVNVPLTWWTHLVLIYYKRNFCNKHKPEQCPIRAEYDLPCLCCREKATKNDYN